MSIEDKANFYRNILASYRELKFDPGCVRKKSNVGTLNNSNFEKWYLEHPNDLIDPEFVQTLRLVSPKLHKLLKTIAYLDAKDQREHGHMFKHFIFSDIKSSTKLLAAGLVASGFRIGVKPIIATRGKHKGKPVGIELLSTEELARDNSGKGHFDLMASGSVFNKAMTTVQKKQLFARFNARDDSEVYPRNNHGEQVRIIIMDNGFKEGVDLFDIKYVHIFEPQVTMADTKQVVGRGTRTCGQKGLTFDPERGWPLHVYVYDLDLGKSKGAFLESYSAFDLYLKALGMDLRLVKLNAEMEQMIMEGAVDYELNKAVHDFRGKGDKEADYSWSRTATPEISFHLLDEDQGVEEDGDFIYEVAVLPAADNADRLLNRGLNTDVFANGQGEFTTKGYQISLDYDMATIYFKSVRSMETIAKTVYKVAQALLLKPGQYAVEIKNIETDERVPFDYIGSSYKEDDSFASSKDSTDYDGSFKLDTKSSSSLSSLQKEEEEKEEEEEAEAEDSYYQYQVATFPYDESNGYLLINDAFGSSLKGPTDSYKTGDFMLSGDGDILYLYVASVSDMNKVKKLVAKVGSALLLRPSEYGIEIIAQKDDEDIDESLLQMAQSLSEGGGESETLGSGSETLRSGSETLRSGSETLRGGAKIKFTPTQDFVSNYFTPQNPIKGMLLNHSVGTGKTCTAIATATGSFEPQGYTILWVTRTTLKNDIWKNMFDMVCHHGLMDRASMPATQKERMRLLSKSWSIRPISYKQFTNLVTKANSYYARLVKKNGAVDPLRKTLLVIDEAHKLFGGNDLSSIERPDTAKLHHALMSSYEISGDDSVRLLLMTATPITKDPLELVKLLNLCKLPDQQIPDTLGEFAAKYLKEDGSFSETGRRHFLDDIAGHISYLNREKDARQFSQPVMHHVNVPFNNKAMIRSLDKHIISRNHELETRKLKVEVAQKAEEIENHFKTFDKFMVPHSDVDVCKKIKTPALQKKCKTAVNKKRMALVKSVKKLAKTKRGQIKGIKGQVKELTRAKKSKLVSIKREMNRDRDFYKDVYMKSAYYKLAACGKVDTENKGLSKVVAEQPDVRDLDLQVEHLKTVVPADIMALAARIKAERKILTKERLRTLRSELKGKRDRHKTIVKLKLKTLKKERKSMAKAHKKTLTAEKKVAIQAEKVYKKEQEALKKLARQEGEAQEIVNAELKGMVDAYMQELPGDERIQELVEMDRAKVAALEAKAQAKAEKAEAAAAKKAATLKAKAEKAEAALEKKRAAEEKKAAVAAAKEEKKRAAEEKKAATLKAKADAKANATRKKAS